MLIPYNWIYSNASLLVTNVGTELRLLEFRYFISEDFKEII